MKNIKQFTTSLEVSTVDFWESYQKHMERTIHELVGYTNKCSITELVAQRLCEQNGITLVISDDRSEEFASNRVIHTSGLSDPTELFYFFYKFSYIVLSNEYHIEKVSKKYGLSLEFAKLVGGYLFPEHKEYFNTLVAAHSFIDKHNKSQNGTIYPYQIGVTELGL